MIIDCISDLHGHYPNLRGGDLLIVAGDFTENDTKKEHEEFLLWIQDQNYRKKIFISGNHDNFYQNFGPINMLMIAEYLCDSGTEFEGLKIWGSPWTKKFEGMNPKCMAFTCEGEKELAKKFKKIPKNTDILITHSPPFGCLDENTVRNHCGSAALSINISRVQPALCIFGHVHESYGKITAHMRMMPKHRIRREIILINASHCNERYEPVNQPIRVIL